MTAEPGWERALVIGSGIGGLATARVLAEHFSRVTVVDKDHVSIEGAPRPGVPQARHVHGLLGKGAEVLEGLFPGLCAELETLGAVCFDHGQGVCTHTPHGPVPRARVGRPIQVFTRELLESRIRRRVVAIPSVQVTGGVRVTGLRTDSSGRRVVGVTAIRLPSTPSPASEDVLPTDLVVDASGRFSALPQWLEAIGYPQPRDRVVNAGLAYSTCLFDGPDEDWRVIYHVNSAPHLPRGAYAIRTESGQWLVTLFGAAGDHPPVKLDGFSRFAQSLNNPELKKIVDGGNLVAGVHHYARTENRLREYHRLPRWPERLVVLGDAVCAFNPIYGQGMTVASLEAVALGAQLTRSRTGAETRPEGRLFQQRLPWITAVPWLLSTNEDQLWQAHMNGHRARLSARALHWYMNKLLDATITDPQVYRAFLNVFHMVRRPTHLARPSVLLRALTST
ncbi:MAG: NAD(P)-binding protein [Pseudonocardiaceae bacterium]